MEVNFDDVQWRFTERVKRLMDKGRTKEEAEETVKSVILTKEIPQEVIVDGTTNNNSNT